MRSGRLGGATTSARAGATAARRRAGRGHGRARCRARRARRGTRAGLRRGGRRRACLRRGGRRRACLRRGGRPARYNRSRARVPGRRGVRGCGTTPRGRATGRPTRRTSCGARLGNAQKQGRLLAQRRYGCQQDADGEHGDAHGQGGPQHRLAPVPGPLRCPLRAPGRAAVRRGRGMPATHCPPAPGQASDESGDRQAERGQPVPPGRGVGRTRPDLFVDPLQAIRARLHPIGGSVQLAAHELGKKVVPAVGTAARCHHYCCSNAVRRDAMPRAVWLFTAPRLMSITAAISASERSR
jgi:hypothetical protein